MSAIDQIFLIAVLSAALLALSGLALRRANAALLVTAALAGAVQISMEGPYWHFVPAYLMLAVLALRLIIHANVRGAARIAWNAGIVALALTATLPLVVAPVAQIPPPNGRYAVGTTVHRWLDQTRREPEGGQRNVIAQLWYPASPGGQDVAPYIDAVDRLPEFISLIPRQMMVHYGRIDSHAIADAPLLANAERWPLVVFSPGYGAPRAFYTTLAVDLASRGFIVATLDHPYESAVTMLADGTIATPRAAGFGDDGSAMAHMVSQQQVRARDITFALEAILASDLGPEIDINRIAAVGHSFGGASAAAAALIDDRITAVANIDGTPYGDLPEQRLGRPFLLIESDHTATGHSGRYLAGNAALIANADATTARFEIRRSSHYDFTDAPLFFGPLGQWMLARLTGTSRPPDETLRATVDILEAFLNGAPTGTASAAYEDIVETR